jgi:CDP-paratose 2-epimerase
MRVLITGVSGFVGSVLAKTLFESGKVTSIVGIDNFSRPGSELNRQPLKKLGVDVRFGDIRNASDLDSLPMVDWVIDAAAQASVLSGLDGSCSSRQVIEHNLLGTMNVLEYCRQHSSGLILLSSSRVYSIPPLAKLQMRVEANAFEPIESQDWPMGVSPEGISELCSTAPPASLYGSLKFASEQLSLEYGLLHQFPVWVNRCGVMGGAGQLGHATQGIIAYWIHSYREGKPLRYIGFNGSGYQVRDCLHPSDLARLVSLQIHSAGDLGHPQVVNVSGGQESAWSLHQLSMWCDNRFGVKKIDSDSTVRPFDLPWIVLDSKVARDVWGWQPQVSIVDVFSEVAEHAERHPHWLEHSMT